MTYKIKTLDQFRTDPNVTVDNSEDGIIMVWSNDPKYNQYLDEQLLSLSYADIQELGILEDWMVHSVSETLETETLETETIEPKKKDPAKLSCYMEINVPTVQYGSVKLNLGATITEDFTAEEQTAAIQRAMNIFHELSDAVLPELPGMKQKYTEILNK